MKKESTTWLKAGWLHALMRSVASQDKSHFSYQPTFIRFSVDCNFSFLTSVDRIQAQCPAAVGLMFLAQVVVLSVMLYNVNLNMEVKICVIKNDLMMHPLSDHLNLTLFYTLGSSARVNIHSQHLRQRWQKVISHSCSLLAYWSKRAVIDEVDPKLTQYEWPQQLLCICSCM